MTPVGDFNQHAYIESLANYLAEPDLGMVEQVKKSSDEKMLLTHVSRIRPIC